MITVQILPYVQTSVFVDNRYPFGGNQLATFWNKKENAQIKTKTMQGIALEMNFSETTFIEESSINNCSAKVRIFTPAKEITFAGHPELRRILLPDEFTAHPLRKDYPLQGRGERHNFQTLARRDA